MNKKLVIKRASQIVSQDSMVGDGGNIVYIYTFTPSETSRVESVVREECLPILVRNVARPLPTRK